MPRLVVFRARSLGGAVLDRFLADGSRHGRRGRTDELRPSPTGRPPVPWS